MVAISSPRIARGALFSSKPNIKIDVAKLLSVLILCAVTSYLYFVHRTIRNGHSTTLLQVGEILSPPLPIAEQSNRSPIVVGYAVSITKCGSDSILDASAVLKQSVHLTSVHGNMGGKYDYQMYVIYHPTAESCALPLANLGYKLLKRDTIVAVKDIKGEWLRSKIEESGCCGEKELIKLEVFTLEQHPIVVHLDLDVLVLKPMDTLFDVMLGLSNLSKLERMLPNEPLPEVIEAAFTHDYAMMNRKKHRPAQGGFMVFKPSLSVYEEFKEIIRVGDYRKTGGWGGKMGPFWGAHTIQGLIPYYYDVLYSGRRSVGLNRCIYNNMCDNPRDKKTVNDVVQGKCLTGEENCEDCRSRPLEDIVSTHFTICQKPWNCLPHNQDTIQHRLCRKLTREWYRIRSDFEKGIGRTGKGPGSYRDETFFGYCENFGSAGYLPINLTTS